MRYSDIAVVTELAIRAIELPKQKRNTLVTNCYGCAFKSNSIAGDRCVSSAERREQIAALCATYCQMARRSYVNYLTLSLIYQQGHFRRGFSTIRPAGD